MDLRSMLIANLENPDGGEGIVDHAYFDTTGNLTGWMGHKILYGDINPATGKQWQENDPISAETGEVWAETDVSNAINDAPLFVSKFGITFDNLPDYCKLAIYELLFNLGEGRFSAFVNTLALIREGNYSGAAAHILQNSLWVSQVHQERADRIAAEIAGTWTPPSQPVTEVAENP
jgi:GH24 family phage-related lysozyme (muramidase)